MTALQAIGALAVLCAFLVILGVCRAAALGDLMLGDDEMRARELVRPLSSVRVLRADDEQEHDA